MADWNYGCSHPRMLNNEVLSLRESSVPLCLPGTAVPGFQRPPLCGCVFDEAGF